MDNLKQINKDVKNNRHASTRPKLNAKFQSQGPLLPERKGFEYQLMKEGNVNFLVVINVHHHIHYPQEQILAYQELMVLIYHVMVYQI